VGGVTIIAAFMTKRPSAARWWAILAIALFVIAAWPPDEDKSLIAKFVNWAVDPAGNLPVLPPQLGYGLGDDPHAVEERDAQVRRYDELYNRGGWTRTRLELKVAGDPLPRGTERQLLLAVAAIAMFAVFMLGWGSRKLRN
jgi:hypothetical protein